VGDGKQETTPYIFALQQNYPNPFNPTTRISYTLPKAMLAEVAVYDILGQRVKTLVSEEQHAGDHYTRWDGTNVTGNQVASGVYFCRLVAGDRQLVTKMMLMR